MGRFLTTLSLLGLGALAVLTLAPVEVEGPLGHLRRDIREGVGLDPRSTPTPGPTGTAQATPTPPSTLQPTAPDEREAEIEARFHALVNQTRAENGLPVLAHDAELAVVARYHSQRMGELDFFAHVDPHNGDDPTARGRRFDNRCTKIEGLFIRTGIGENLYMKRGPRLSPDDEARRALDGLMSSPGHRENILREEYDAEGVGVYEAGGALWLTQNFC